jgi:hypothetical protein
MSPEGWKRLHGIFHTLWTKAVGTPGYSKREWQELEAIIFRNAPHGFMKPPVN